MCSGWFNNLYAFFGSEMSFVLYSGRAAAAEAIDYIPSVSSVSQAEG